MNGSALATTLYSFPELSAAIIPFDTRCPQSSRADEAQLTEDIL